MGDNKNLLFWENKDVNKFAPLIAQSDSSSKALYENSSISAVKTENLMSYLTETPQKFADTNINKQITNKIQSIQNNVSLLNENTTKNYGFKKMQRQNNELVKSTQLLENNFAQKYYVNTNGNENINKEKSVELRESTVKEKSRQNLTDIKVDMSGMNNNINNDSDIELVIRKLSEKLESALLTSAEGVHYSA